MLEEHHQRSYQAQRPRFATTHWSVVRAAGKSSSIQQREALETLCQSYWFPLYAFLRRGATTAIRQKISPRPSSGTCLAEEGP